MKWFTAKNTSLFTCLLLSGTTSLPALSEELNLLTSDILSKQINGVLALDQQFVVEQLIKRNAQIIYAQLQNDIAKQQVLRESSVFELELFSNIRYEDSQTQASASDRTSSQFQNQAAFDQQQTQYEIGVSAFVKTGAQISLSYQNNKKSNNFIPLDTFSNGEDTEYKGSINLSITQPLLKGRGATQADSRIQQAELEHLIVSHQFQQRVMRTSFEGLSAYWQLYRLNELKSIRQQSLINAQKSEEDVQGRVAAGRLSETVLLEARSNVLNRQAQLESILNEYAEAESRIKTLLNFALSDEQNIRFELLDLPNERQVNLNQTFQDYFDRVLENWAAYKISKFQQDVYRQNLRLAEDGKKPTLDLSVGFSTNGLGYTYKDSYNEVTKSDYPSWYAGLNFSMPLQGNQRAQSEINIAKNRIYQADVDMKSVKVVLANDLRTRFDQVLKAYDELSIYRENVDLLERLLKSEQELFLSGARRISDVYDRENRLNEAKNGYINSKVKYELAKLSLYLAEGSLLSRYNVNVMGL